MAVHWPGYAAQQEKRRQKVWTWGQEGHCHPLPLSRPALAHFPLPLSLLDFMMCHKSDSSSSVLINPFLSPFSPLILLPRFGPSCLLTLHSFLWRPYVLPSRMNPSFVDTFPFVCVLFHFFHQSRVLFSVQIFHLLGKIYSEVFIIFDAIVNGIVFFLFQIFCCQCIDTQLISIC